MPDRLSQLATGIGSLPDMGVKKAIKLVIKTFPQCPHWPQFPVRPEEYYSSQFLNPLVKLGIIKREKRDNPRFLNGEPDFLDKVTQFYELYLENMENSHGINPELAIPHGSAAGFYTFLNNLEKKGTGDALFLKGQVVGPLTAGIQTLDEEDNSSFFDDQLRDLIIKTLELHLTWQIRELKKYGLPVIIFIDEGMMHAYGHRQFLSLKGHWITDAFADLISTIKREGAIPGIHACSMADWSILIPSQPLIINLDVYNYFTSLLTVSDDLNEFLQKGGFIAWGIVPVCEACFTDTVSSLKERLNRYVKSLCKKGIEEKLVQKQMIITPTCGTGLYPPEQAQRVYELTAELSEAVKKGL